MQDGSAAWWILFWWLAFAGSHMVLSSTQVRPRLVARLGNRAFAGLYSVVALATFFPLVSVYLRSRHTGPVLWSFGTVPGASLAAILLGTAAFALLVASFVQPSPAGMDPRAGARRHGFPRPELRCERVCERAALLLLLVVPPRPVEDHVALTGVIADAPEQKKAALLRGRYQDSEVVQIVVPANVLDDLMETVFTIQNYVILGLAILSLATVAVITLVFLLSQQLRVGEFSTLRRIGASRTYVWMLIVSEVLFIFLISALLAAALTITTRVFAMQILQVFLAL